MGTKVCNKCKYLMDDGSDFCEKCGSKYEPILSKAEDSQSNHTCASCMRELSAGASFCPHCGTKNPILDSGMAGGGLGQEMSTPAKEENAAGNSIIKYLGVAFLVLVIAVLFMASKHKDGGVSDKDNNKAQSSSPPKVERPPPPPPPSINLKLNTYQKRSGKSLSEYLDIQVMNENLTVQKVTINRGGCQILNQSFGVNTNGPLKFGDTLTYLIMPYPNCNVAEVEVITNLGTMTYTFN